MEENKVLTEEEEEQVNGGTSEDTPFQPMRIFCPACKSYNISVKSFSLNANKQLIVVHNCNDCGFEWEVMPKKVDAPSFDPMFQ